MFEMAETTAAHVRHHLVHQEVSRDALLEDVTRNCTMSAIADSLDERKRPWPSRAPTHCWWTCAPAWKRCRTESGRGAGGQKAGALGLLKQAETVQGLREEREMADVSEPPGDRTQGYEWRRGRARGQAQVEGGLSGGTSPAAIEHRAAWGYQRGFSYGVALLPGIVLAARLARVLTSRTLPSRGSRTSSLHLPMVSGPPSGVTAAGLREAAGCRQDASRTRSGRVACVGLSSWLARRHSGVVILMLRRQRSRVSGRSFERQVRYCTSAIASSRSGALAGVVAAETARAPLVDLR
jgi:hypothetical protein